MPALDEAETALYLVEIIGKRLLKTKTALEDLIFKKVCACLTTLLLRMTEQ